jgi:hypothetical protein
MASRTTEWRHRTGRCKPRPAPPGHDAVWCAVHESDIWEWADHGARQAIVAAQRWWGQWETLAPEEVRQELRAVAMLRICEISADPRRDRPGFMVVAARWACQSHIKQHIIGWLKRTTELACATADDIAIPENCRDLVAALQSMFPGDHWADWQEHPDETGDALRKIMATRVA